MVTTNPEKSTSIYYRNTSCGCYFCLNDEYDKCEYIQQFKDLHENIKRKEHSFSLSAQKGQNSIIDNESELSDLNEEEVETNVHRDRGCPIHRNWGHRCYKNSGCLCLLFAEVDIISLHNHISITTIYFLHIIEQSWATTQKLKKKLVLALCYVDQKREAIISAFCVVGNCPTPTTMTVKKHGKDVEMLLIDNDMHQSLCELVDYEQKIIFSIALLQTVLI